MKYSIRTLCSLAMAVVLSQVAPVYSQERAGQASANATDKAVEETIEKGLKFLRESQSEDGTFSIKAGPGLTALAITAAIRCGEPLDSPLVTKGLAALEKYIKPDGGIYGNGRLANYETCIGILCFVEANTGGKYNKTLQDAKKFILSMQYGSAADSSSEDDVWNGGVGYSGKGRPDLSNTAYMIEALHSLDTGANDPAIQAALEFVSRCQNFDNPHNQTQFAAKVNDGGFFYELPKDSIDPKKDEEAYTPNGGITSYGTMTYAGYKSMIYAGLTESDPRVATALKWIQSNYTLESNPGKGQAGVYYYYHTFSAALDAAGKTQLTDKAGASHDWKSDLAAALAKRQAADGSWSNENRRWFEDDKNLATSFALLSLANCKSQAASTPAKSNSGDTK